MKHTIRQVFHSGKFLVGFAIITTILVFVFVYPLIVTDPPLAIIGQGTFFPPGVYVSVYDSVGSTNKYILNLDSAVASRIASKLNNEDRTAMRDWLVAAGISQDQIDINNTTQLLTFWENNYDPTKNIPGMTNARRNYYIRLNTSLQGLLSTEGATIAAKNPQTGALEPTGLVSPSDYVNIGQVANVRVLPLGTDNFGRDVLTELVMAIRVSLVIGIVAGTIATTIGLTLGLLGGYVGGRVDDVIMFFTNLFTVIPSFILLI